MASVFRGDTNELIGYLVELHGPLLPGTTSWPFRAWPQSTGTLRGQPEAPNIRGGRFTAPPAVTIHIPVSNIESSDMHLHVPMHLLDFIVNHPYFRATQLPSHD
ncbi:hypothetical protein MHY1_00293 [Methylovirgula sp. HY1]|nr:hypothetical protein MHY1_00293 [Methylovirgula sp. HY1]